MNAKKDTFEILITLSNLMAHIFIEMEKAMIIIMEIANNHNLEVKFIIIISY